MQDLISQFLSEKQLANNSQKAYQYDLEQFLEICQEQINPSKLAIYQAFLQDLAPTVQRRKLSAVNQFLYFLYESDHMGRYYKLKRQEKAVSSSEKALPSLEDLSDVWQETTFLKGQLIALFILELGLLPNEIAQLKTEQVDLAFQVVSLEAGQQKRILPLPTAMLSYLESELGGYYVFEHKGKTYSRQWFYNRLKEFTQSLGKDHWTAQFLRDQYVLRQLEKGKTLDQVAKNLGLTSHMGLEKYR